MQGIFVLACHFFLGYSLGMDILMHTQHIRDRLQSSGATHIQINKASGGDLSVSWLSKFGRGVLDNPSVHNVALLESVLNQLETQNAS